jgi:ELWxxDGT repeat protein
VKVVPASERASWRNAFQSRGAGYFFANPGYGPGNDLWKTDGTAGGTTLVAAGVVAPTQLLNAGGHIYSDGASIWSSDGTAGGSGPLLGGNTEGTVLQAGSTTYIVAGFPATTLYTTDGTPAGTTPIFSTTGSKFIASPISFAGELYFLVGDYIANDVQIWSSNGTTAGTVAVKDLGTWQQVVVSGHGLIQLEAIGNRLFVGGTQENRRHGPRDTGRGNCTPTRLWWRDPGELPVL